MVKKKTNPTAKGASKKAVAAKGAVKKERGPTSLFNDTVLHFPGALSEKDLAKMCVHFGTNEVQGELFEAVLHDSTNTQYSSRKCDAAWLRLAAVPGQRKIRAAVKVAQERWELLPTTAGGSFRCEYEDAQYTEYRGDQGGHFKQWHVDADDGGADAEDARAITVVALLAEPGDEFEGGAFEVMTPQWPNGTKQAVAWKKGDLIAFPSTRVWHRVMPTTAGVRKTLVVWAKDPAYFAAGA